MGLPVLLEELCRLILGIYKLLTHMNVESGAEAELFQEKEYINGIANCRCSACTAKKFHLSDKNFELIFICSFSFYIFLLTFQFHIQLIFGIIYGSIAVLGVFSNLVIICIVARYPSMYICSPYGCQ
jgi:hypothetical protein